MEIQRVEPRNTDEPQGTGSPISRRTVVAVGVAAAWTIPLIQLATASPAAAASGTPVMTFLPALTGVYQGTGQAVLLDVTGTFNTTGGTGSRDYTLIVVVPDGAWKGTPLLSGNTSGWTTSGNVQSGLTWTFTFTATISNSGTALLDGIQFNLNDSGRPPFTLSATVNYVDGTAVPASFPVIH